MAYKPPAKTIDNETADKITSQAVWQIYTSRQFKLPRMTDIEENEKAYYNQVQKLVRNPFNESFPYMAGYVNFLRAKIEDDSTLSFTHDAENDLKRAAKIQGMYEKVSKSILPNDSWELKHRHAKFNAIFSGVGIYYYYAESVDQEYKSNLEVVSHYDFHCEPRGGALLENHLFCGHDNIFKTEQELTGSTYYNQGQVKKLLAEYNLKDYKDNTDYNNIRNNRYYAMKQDPVVNNYTGQRVIKLAQFFTMYEGQRYYILFNEITRTWIRICPIEDMFPSGLYPYFSWHTHEDPDMFWTKAPADDAIVVKKIIDTLINQELYSRQKANYGETFYDPDMFPNIQALVDSRPDKHVPFDSKNGTRSVTTGLYRPTANNLEGTLELITWLDQFTGKQIGRTSSAAGQSEDDKKVAVFKGEIAQVDELLNVNNKSFRYAISHLGLRFKQGLDANLKKPVAIKIMGANGVEWEELSPEDLKTDQDLVIQAVGGSSELELEQIENTRKTNVLADPTLQSVNPQWKDRQRLLIAGFNEEDVKDAFSADTFAKKELMSEAAQAEKDIVEGKKPELNRGADSNFMQHIIDFATDTEDLSTEQYKTLMDYAMAHVDIAVENEARNIKEMIRQKRLQAMSQNGSVASQNPTAPAPTKSPVQAPPVDNPAPIQ